MKDLLLELQNLIHKATADYQNRIWLRYDIYCSQFNKLLLMAKAYLKDVAIAPIDRTATKKSHNKQGQFEAYDMLAERVKLKEVIDRANSLLELLMTFLVPATGTSSAPAIVPAANAEADVELVCNKFCSVVRELRRRSEKGTLLEIDTNCDAIYLFKALLRLYFDSLVEDSWQTSLNNTERALLIRTERIVLLVRKTHRNLTDQILINELTDAINYYSQTNEYTSLIYFIYDPDLRISQPAYLESQLMSLDTKELSVKIFIRPLS